MITKLKLIDSHYFTEIEYEIDFTTYISPRVTIIDTEDRFFSMMSKDIENFISELTEIKGLMESYNDEKVSES